MKELIAFGIGVLTGAFVFKVFNDERENGPKWYSATGEEYSQENDPEER